MDIIQKFVGNFDKLIKEKNDFSPFDIVNNSIGQNQNILYFNYIMLINYIIILTSIYKIFFKILIYMFFS